MNYGNARQRRLFIEGNSLMDQADNGVLISYGRYVAMQTYNLLSKTKPLAGVFHPIGGQNQTQINSAFTTRIQPYLITNDIYLIWEGRNDISIGLTGAQAYANLITCVNNVRALGAKVVVGTCIYSDFAGQLANQNADMLIYNNLVKTNSNLFDAIADIGANANFNTLAGCSNLTYYISDKLHLAKAGQDLAASILASAITPLL